MELLPSFLESWFRELYRSIIAGSVADIIFLGIVFFLVLARIWAGNENTRRLLELKGVSEENSRLRRSYEQSKTLLREGAALRDEKMRQLEERAFAAEKRALEAEIEAKKSLLEVERMRNPFKTGME